MYKQVHCCTTYMLQYIQFVTYIQLNGKKNKKTRKVIGKTDLMRQVSWFTLISLFLLFQRFLVFLGFHLTSAWYEWVTRCFFLWWRLSKTPLEDALLLFLIPMTAAQSLPPQQVAYAMQGYTKLKILRDWESCWVIPDLLRYPQLRWEMRI